MGKFDILKNFKVSDDIDDLMGKAVTELDCNFSELMRTSFLLALPQIIVNPSLLKTIRLEGLDIGTTGSGLVCAGLSLGNGKEVE